MRDDVFEEILSCIKILNGKKLLIPDNKTQHYNYFYRFGDIKEKYKMLINRRGHVREEPLSFSFFSEKHGYLVRLDMTGTPHEDMFGNELETPHVHIFDETHDNGKKVVPLSQITNEEIINELYDSLVAFLQYCNADLTNIEIPIV